jgi:IMP dehydrogenase
MKNCLSFDDVLLTPRYSDIASRKEINLSTTLGRNRSFSLPIISSPMDTVTEDAMAIEMSNHGGLGVIHRYNSIEEQCEIIRKAKFNDANLSTAAAAIGVSGDFMERAQELYKVGIRIFCVDIAHGHHALMRHALKVLRNTYGYDIHIMAGNVATREGYEDLASWGADSVRVGIGGGSICSTRIQTGHGMPTLQSVIECSESHLAGDVPIIADGGIKNSGDMVKALAAGADFVMVGSLLAGTNETPGGVYTSQGRQLKVYRGMASKDAQMEWRGHTSSIEGVTSSVPARGPVSTVLEELTTGIRSGFSYSGCRNITELQTYSKFIGQTTAGSKESSTHILNRS